MINIGLCCKIQVCNSLHKVEWNSINIGFKSLHTIV